MFSLCPSTGWKEVPTHWSLATGLWFHCPFQGGTQSLVPGIFWGRGYPSQDKHMGTPPPSLPSNQAQDRNTPVPPSQDRDTQSPGHGNMSPNTCNVLPSRHGEYSVNRGSEPPGDVALRSGGREM